MTDNKIQDNKTSNDETQNDEIQDDKTSNDETQDYDQYYDQYYDQDYETQDEAIKINEYKSPRDRINKENVKFTISYSSNFYIYVDKSDGTSWEVDIISDHYEDSIAETLRLKGLITSKVPRNKWYNCSMMLGSALAASLAVNENSDVKKYFTHVEEDINKEAAEIERVISQGKNFYIYRKVDGGILWWHNNTNDKRLKPAIAEYQRLISIINISLSKKYKKHARGQLASALSNAFNSHEDVDPIVYFKQIEEFIYSRANVDAKILQMVCVTSTAFLIFLLGLLFYNLLHTNHENISHIIIGCVSGVLGSLISIIPRNDKISTDFLAPVSNFVLQGLTRLFMGCLSGVTIVIIIKSKFITGIQFDNIYAICICAIVSGFSERFIPDILEKNSKNLSKNTNINANL